VERSIKQPCEYTLDKDICTVGFVGLFG